MGRFAGVLIAGSVLLGVSTCVAYADACSGHSHTTGTVLGAVGGGIIGNKVIGGVGGTVGGAVVGGLAGNAIARDIDCNDQHHHHHHHHHHHDDDEDR